MTRQVGWYRKEGIWAAQLATFWCLQEKWKKETEDLEHHLENVKSIYPSFLNYLKLQLRFEMVSTRCYNCYGHDFTHCGFNTVLAAAASCLTHRYPRGDTKLTSDHFNTKSEHQQHMAKIQRVKALGSERTKISGSPWLNPKYPKWLCLTHFEPDLRMYLDGIHWINKTMWNCLHCIFFPQTQCRHIWWACFLSLLSQRPREMDFQHCKFSLQIKRSHSHEPDTLQEAFNRRRKTNNMLGIKAPTISSFKAKWSSSHVYRVREQMTAENEL